MWNILTHNSRHTGAQLQEQPAVCILVLSVLMPTSLSLGHFEDLVGTLIFFLKPEASWGYSSVAHCLHSMGSIPTFVTKTQIGRKTGAQTFWVEIILDPLNVIKIA